MNKLVSTNPAKNYQIVGEVDISTEDEVTAMVQAAHAAKSDWRNLGIKERLTLIRKITDDFIAERQKIVELITAETGKSISESQGEFERYISFAEWYLEHGESAIADEIVSGNPDDSKHRIVYEPWGLVVAISPWNFPFGMALWGILPNLLVGNVVIAKTSEECPLVGKLMETIINRHLPDGVFCEAYGDGEVGDFLTDQEIDYIWFTGSTRTGRYLYRKAAEKFIRVTLEMGGSSPCIVFEDADPKRAAEVIYAQRFRNCGQVCTSLKRLIVHESIMDKVVSELIGVLQTKQIGDPAEYTTDTGSLVAKRQVEHLQSQVDDAISNGAKVAYKPDLSADLEGAFFAPTVLTNIKYDMRVWNEEVFGPVLPVVPFKDEAEAIVLANDTQYGLNARVISADSERAKRVAHQIDAGGIKLNYENSISQADPFGGYKLSGMGREHGIVGLRELCQIKVIVSEE